MTRTKAILWVAFAAILRGTPSDCIPDVTHDGVSLPAACYGGQLKAIPLSNWIIGFNDNPGGGDWDANEPTFYARISASGFQVIYELIGSITANKNNSVGQIVGGQIFGPGAVAGSTVTKSVIDGLIVPLYGISNGVMYFSGPGNLNSDGVAHFVVTQITQTPEPATWLMVMGAIAIGAFYRRFA